MIRMRFVWPVALLALSLQLPIACTTDDADDSGEGSAADDTNGEVDELGCAAGAVGMGTDGATDPLMQTWGAPCTSDQDCIDLIGDPEAICDNMAVVYELPGGYCTKPCSLPDMQTQSVLDDPGCDPDGGVACIGVMGTFERCGIVCSDDAQCNRDGYICRQLPLIALPEDPSMCLMPDCCLDSCTEE